MTGLLQRSGMNRYPVNRYRRCPGRKYAWLTWLIRKALNKNRTAGPIRDMKALFDGHVFLHQRHGDVA